MSRPDLAAFAACRTALAAVCRARSVQDVVVALARVPEGRSARPVAASDVVDSANPTYLMTDTH